MTRPHHPHRARASHWSCVPSCTGGKGLGDREAISKPEQEPLNQEQAWRSHQTSPFQILPRPATMAGYRVPGTDTQCPAVTPTVGTDGSAGSWKHAHLSAARQGLLGETAFPPGSPPKLSPAPPGCLPRQWRRVSGEGGIPGETPPVPQQPGGQGGPEPAGWLRRFLFNRKRNYSCFILSRVALAGSKARHLPRLSWNARAFHPLWLFF